MKDACHAGCDGNSKKSDPDSTKAAAMRMQAEANWESEGGAPRMSWNDVRHAAKDAYYLVHAERSPKELSGEKQESFDE